MSAAAPRPDWGAFQLTSGQEARLEALLGVVASDPGAPTAVRDRDEAARTHVADALTALSLAELRDAHEIVDIGSGAGFPGLPLAVALPDARVVLLESQRRKCAFLADAVREIDLANARIVCARAEEWREGHGGADAAVARAVASQPVVLEYAAPLLRIGGVLVDWRGRRDEADEAAGLRAASELGLERVRVERTHPFAGARAHHLHVFTKRTETPARFPRRPGVARKRPLGA